VAVAPLLALIDNHRTLRRSSKRARPYLWPMRPLNMGALRRPPERLWVCEQGRKLDSASCRAGRANGAGHMTAIEAAIAAPPTREEWEAGLAALRAELRQPDQPGARTQRAEHPPAAKVVEWIVPEA
jgi:hypothetical protein